MKNKGYYERFKQEQKQKEKEENLRKKYGISDSNKVVIEEKKAIDKVIFYSSNFIRIIFKIVIYIGLFGLSTIGATIVMNEILRETFFELISAIM